MPLHDRDFGVLIRAALTGLSAVVLIAAAAPGARADDEEDDKADFGTSFLRNVLSSVGLQRSDSRPDINYRERSPLVVPPKIDLPPPEAPSTANDPRWPTDPDVKRRREAATARKREVFDSSIEDSRLMTPAEISRGRVAGGNAKAAPRGNRDVDETVLPASEMTKGSRKSGIMSIFRSEPETATFVAEPPRTALTEPPVGYRTPSAGQAYGLGQAAPAQPYDLKNRKGVEE
jgi:hypothetical protein